MAVLGLTTGTDNQPKSIIGYIEYSTCDYKWLHEIGYASNLQFDYIRFGDANGDGHIDGNFMVALTWTYPRTILIINSADGHATMPIQTGPNTGNAQTTSVLISTKKLEAVGSATSVSMYMINYLGTTKPEFWNFVLSGSPPSLTNFV